MLSIGVPALRFTSIAFLLAGVCIISGTFFQALGYSIYSMMVSFCRQLIFLLPLAWLFAQTGDVNRVWIAWPIAELASLCCCMFFLRRLIKNVINPLKEKSRR